jgi:hypothetical protein
MMRRLFLFLVGILFLIAGVRALTCSEQNGNICGENQYCNGSILDASDSDGCCASEMVVSSYCRWAPEFGGRWTCTPVEVYNSKCVIHGQISECSQCGVGWNNLCDRYECKNSLNEWCGFDSGLFFGSCSLAKDFSGEQVCKNGECRNIQKIYDCQELSDPSVYYLLQNDVVADYGNCFDIKSNNVILDLNGKNVSVANGGSSGINSHQYNNLEVKNGSISCDLVSGLGGFGISLMDGANNKISDVNLKDCYSGLYVYSSSYNVFNRIVSNGSPGSDLFSFESVENEFRDSVFNSYESINSKFIFENEFGKIEFLDFVSGSGSSFAYDFRISQNSIYIDSVKNPGLNKGARLSFNVNVPEGKTAEDVVIYRDDEIVYAKPIVSIEGNTVSFEVDGFSQYSINFEGYCGNGRVDQERTEECDSGIPVEEGGVGWPRFEYEACIKPEVGSECMCDCDSGNFDLLSPEYPCYCKCNPDIPECDGCALSEDKNENEICQCNCELEEANVPGDPCYCSCNSGLQECCVEGGTFEGIDGTECCDNSKIYNEEEEECVSVPQPTVRVYLDPQYVDETSKNRKFVPNKITPYDDIICELEIDDLFSDSFPDSLPGRILTAGDSLVVSGSLIKQGIAKSGNIVYQWKINGWDYDGSNGKTGKLVGWADEGQIGGIIASGYAKCEVDFNGQVFSVDSSQKDGSWAQPCSSCLQIYGNSEKDYSVVATRSLGSDELSASSIKMAQILAGVGSYDERVYYNSELSGSEVGFPGFSCSSPGRWSLYLETALGDSAGDLYGSEDSYEQIYAGDSLQDGLTALRSHPVISGALSNIKGDAFNAFMEEEEIRYILGDARLYLEEKRESATGYWDRSSLLKRTAIVTAATLVVGGAVYADINYNDASILRKIPGIRFALTDSISIKPLSEDMVTEIGYKRSIWGGNLVFEMEYDWDKGAATGVKAGFTRVLGGPY